MGRLSKSDRIFNLSLKFSSLYNKLSSYNSPECELNRRFYSNINKLVESSENIVSTISEEINSEFNKCNPQN